MQNLQWRPTERMIEGFENGGQQRNLDASQALQGFYQAKRRALLRKTRALLGKASAQSLKQNADGRTLELPIEGITHLIRDGKAVTLPRLRARFADLWVSEHARFSRGEDSFSSFQVKAGRGGWALEGGMRALVRLEILRYAGWPTIEARCAVSVPSWPRSFVPRSASGGAAISDGRAAS